MNAWHSRLTSLKKEVTEKDDKDLKASSSSTSTPSLGEVELEVDEHISDLSSLLRQVPEMGPFVRPRIRALTKMTPPLPTNLKYGEEKSNDQDEGEQIEGQSEKEVDEGSQGDDIPVFL
jgi:hypothetical protein